MPSRLAIGTLVLLLSAVSVIYITRLDFAPVYLMQDEVNFSLQAQAIAATGRDTNGRRFPVYFSETGFEAGRDPLIIYAQALALRVLPLSEYAVRLPTACLGVVNVLLMFFVGRQVFGSNRSGLLSALLLAITPAHFVNSRLALSVIYPVPFVLVWLWCLTSIKTSRNRVALAGVGLALGVGVFSYIASLIMMPLYLALTMWFLWKRRATGTIMLVAVVFAIALLPLVWWQIEYPNRYTDLLSVYRVSDVQQFRQRINVVWSFFSPDYLFISGDSRITNSTRAAGMFPLACAILIPIGAVQLARGRLGPIGSVILVGFITAPLASAVSGKLDINRVLFAVPFGVLVAMAGVERLLADRQTSLRLCALALLAAAGLQFRGVYLDYMGPYRVTSAPWFGGNSRAAVTEVLRRSEVPAPPVYLNRRTPIERYWRFYVLALGRPELVEHPVYYDPLAFASTKPPTGSLLVCELTIGACELLAGRASWQLVSTIAELDGTPSFAIYQQR